MSSEEFAAIAVALLAGSELLSYMPTVRANGWVQLIVAALQGVVEYKQKQKRGRR